MTIDVIHTSVSESLLFTCPHFAFNIHLMVLNSTYILMRAVFIVTLALALKLHTSMFNSSLETCGSEISIKT